MSNIKKMARKLTAIGLSLIMVVMLGISVMPLQALAEEEISEASVPNVEAAGLSVLLCDEEYDEDECDEEEYEEKCDEDECDCDKDDYGVEIAYEFDVGSSSHSTFERAFAPFGAFDAFGFGVFGATSTPLIDIRSDFECQNFLAAVREILSVTDTTAPIHASQVETITYLFIANRGITSLAGIEHFTNLSSLDAGWNQLTSLDVSNKTALRSLVVSYNRLNNLDVSNNTALQTLWVSGNQLTNLDVSNHMALRALHVSDNRLTNLDVSNNTALTSLVVSDNQLTNLDVRNNTVLGWLEARNNQLTSLHFSRNTTLTTLNLSNNRLTSLDVSNNTALTGLRVDGNRLTSLDVSNNTVLEWLDVRGNQLTSLDVSNNTALTALDVRGNQLTALDVSNNQSLARLDVRGNNIASVDMITGVGNSLPSVDTPGFWFYPQNEAVASISAGLANAIEQGFPIVLEVGASTLITVENLEAIRDSDRGEVLIVLPNGRMITISDIGDNPVGIDLNMTVEPSAAATTVYGVQVPANSFIINPAASGEFGFTISFTISAQELSEVGLDTGTVNLFHISGAGVVTNRTHPDYMLRNPDRSITVSFDSASRYVLATATPAPPTQVAQATHGVPQTGITGQMVLPIVLASLGLVSIGGAEAYRRNKKKDVGR